MGKPATIMSFNNRSTTCQSMSDNSGKRNITTCFSKASFCPTACTGRGIFACVGEASQCCVAKECESCGGCSAYHTWPGGNYIEGKSRASSPDIHATTAILE